ncbi:MAG TPA: DUF6152 family protein [Steroidobacteraceae bacterium]|nr:DUF6152 family protein [Steroidobacteraceae bacterium]
MKTRFLVTFTLLACGGLGTASAHHSFATFDQNNTKTLVGVVKEVQWTNPHIWVQVLVKSPDTGAQVEWSIEGGSPNGLNRAGWKRSSIKAGDTVEIVIHPLKDGSHGGSMMTVKVNGQPVGRRL